MVEGMGIKTHLAAVSLNGFHDAKMKDGLVRYMEGMDGWMDWIWIFYQQVSRERASVRAEPQNC
jgi:hypothetical protein